MKPKKIVGIVLVAVGVLILVYRGFNYTKESHKGSFAGIDFNVKEKEHVEIPTWSGVVAVVVGVALLLLPMKRQD
jgi:uncharacterized membrane protein